MFSELIHRFKRNLKRYELGDYMTVGEYFHKELISARFLIVMFILGVWYFKDGLVDDSTIQMILAFYIGNNSGAFASALKK